MTDSALTRKQEGITDRQPGWCQDGQGRKPTSTATKVPSWSTYATVWPFFTLSPCMQKHGTKLFAPRAIIPNLQPSTSVLVLWRTAHSSFEASLCLVPSALLAQHTAALEQHLLDSCPKGAKFESAHQVERQKLCQQRKTMAQEWHCGLQPSSTHHNDDGRLADLLALHIAPAPQDAHLYPLICERRVCVVQHAQEIL